MKAFSVPNLEVNYADEEDYADSRENSQGVTGTKFKLPLTAAFSFVTRNLPTFSMNSYAGCEVNEVP